MSTPSESLVNAFEALLKIPGEVAALRQEVQALQQEVRTLRKLTPPQLLTIKEAAERLRVSPITVRRQIANKWLKSVRIGQTVRVDLSSIQKELLPTS